VVLREDAGLVTAADADADATADDEAAFPPLSLANIDNSSLDSLVPKESW